MNISINNSKRSELADEQGFILIVTMLILVVLTALCIGALDNSTFEVQIAANDRQSRVAFNLADGGVYASSKLISESIELSADPVYTDLSYVNILNPLDPDYSPSSAIGDTDVDTIANTAGAFNSMVMGYTPLRTDNLYDFMLRVPGSNGDVFGRIEDRAVTTMAGGGAEFASGASGIGSGSAAGTAVTYDIAIDAYSARNASSQLAARYRKVLGAAGGL